MVYKCSFKKIFASILASTIVTSGILAQNSTLSSSSSVSLLTCSAGEELYTTFGHSAIRVKDDSLDVDLVFNYGTFDFDTPDFYKKFVDGELDYMLSIGKFERFERTYRRENRSVTEHSLDLTLAEKRLLWQKLLTNYRPENRFYRYDFFLDNCATRIRDVIFDVKGLDISAFQAKTDKTFRDCLHECMGKTSWAAQGIDLVLGAKTDERVSAYDKAYLPMYLDSLFIDAGVIVSSKEIVKKDFSVEETDNANSASVWIVFGLFLVISAYILIRERKSGVYYTKASILIFILPILLSILLWYTWLYSLHSVLNNNLNVLWASVLYLPQIICMNKKRMKFAKILARVNNALVALLILLSIFGLQYLPPVTYLMCLILVSRNYQLLKQN